jgi:hypothetical protein
MKKSQQSTDDQITTLGQLAEAMLQKRAVVVPGTVWSAPRPAAVIMQLQGTMILKLIGKGMYLYNKPKKED